MLPQMLEKSCTVACVAAMALICAPALANSSYGYSTSPSNKVSASAQVNLVVNVAKLMLLRVGASTDPDTLTWTSVFDVLASPVQDQTTGFEWTDSVPIAKVSTVSLSPVSAAAWTNAPGGGNLSYAASAFANGGPNLADISVESGDVGTTILSHPEPALLAPSSTKSTTFLPNAVAKANWIYTLGGTPDKWVPGTYNATVTYTATSV